MILSEFGCGMVAAAALIVIGVWLAYCICKYILPLRGKRAGRLDDRKVMSEINRKGKL